VLLLDERQQERQTSDARQRRQSRRANARRELLFGVVKVVSRERHLAQVVRALRAAGRFARRLHRGEKQRDQYANDGDYYQQFHKRETAAKGTDSFHTFGA